MKREILFRGKRLDNGEWMGGDLVLSATYPDKAWIAESKIFIGKQLHGVGVREVDHATVGQYTGLADKNGVKIFEGDILRHGRTLHEVVFERRNRSAYFGWRVEADETWHFDYDFLRQLEVVGNIHDNPELLEETV